MRIRPNTVGTLKGGLMKRFLSISVALALLTMPALAADVPADTHTQAASKLISIIDLERTMMGGATAMVDAMQQQDAALVSYRDTILKWAQKYLTWEALGPKFVAIYAETFTEAELRELIAFYLTPTGKKVLATTPDLMKRGAMIGAEVAQTHTPELEQMIREHAKALEQQKP